MRNKMKQFCYVFLFAVMCVGCIPFTAQQKEKVSLVDRPDVQSVK